MTPQLRNWFVIVVLSIACLIALLGALGRAREQARRANCLSILHCCTLTFALYADLEQGRCPVDDRLTLAGCFRLLTNVTTAGTLYFCPSDSRRHARPEPDLAKLTSLNINYS